MQCVTPLIRIFNPYKVKDKGTIVPRSEVQDILTRHNNDYYRTIKEINAYCNKTGQERKYQLIPCQHCWACNLNYSAEWATRLTLEKQYHKYAYFITLTYDDEHLDIPKLVTDGQKFYRNDGTWNGTLKKKHMDTFLHTIREDARKKGYENIKYFYCGEYGTQTKRPHYHLILFGYPIDHRLDYDTKIDKNHKIHWKNEYIDRIWGKSFQKDKYSPFKDKNGNKIPASVNDIAEVEWSDCAYVARYCMKKLEHEGINYYELGKVPEFIHMSQDIGMQYYRDHKQEIYQTDSLIMKSVKGNTTTYKPPKAYDRQYEKEHPEEFKKIKKKRTEIAEHISQTKDKQTTLTDLEQQTMQLEKLLTKGKMLKREL